ncbi:MAG: hypothetical protein Q9167_006178 [Letrouitia subvulpina]
MSSSNLTRVKRVHNPKYQASGLKSYVYLLNKFNITPTKAGPYFVGPQAQQKGKLGLGRLLGRKTKTQQVLQKKTGKDAKSTTVPAEDQQNDSLALTPPGTTYSTLPSRAPSKNPRDLPGKSPMAINPPLPAPSARTTSVSAA